MNFDLYEILYIVIFIQKVIIKTGNQQIIRLPRPVEIAGVDVDEMTSCDCVAMKFIFRVTLYFVRAYAGTRPARDLTRTVTSGDGDAMLQRRRRLLLLLR